MGKKLAARDVLAGKGLRGQFTRHFRRLTSGLTPTEVAERLKITPDMARKYLRGTHMPDLNALPAVAAKLGCLSWHDLFDSPKSLR